MWVLRKARAGWRALTSMGTALVLLFLLALGAVPGAMLPQRSLNESKVDGYLRENPVLGKIFDRLQLFDVFSSFWFTAIYALLFISLVGCLTPRIVEHIRSMRAAPVPVPRNLARLPRHAELVVAGTPGQVAGRIAGELKGWRRVTRDADGLRVTRDDGGVLEISAEKGYLREFGNIVFHFSLLGLLAAVAVGKLFGYEGNVIVIADGGPGMCSASPAAFDSFRAGNSVDGTSLYPICVRVKNFQAEYLPNGQATSFASDIDYQAGADLATGTWRPYRLEVNHPLRVGGDRVYLQGHGYAPTFTVTFPGGQQRTRTVQFSPDNLQTLLSSGTVRFDPPAGMYPEKELRRHQIAITGLFAPTKELDGTLLSSSYPALNDPAVAVDIYRGDAGLDTGRPQSLFSLDPRLIEQKRLTKVKRVNLAEGEQVTLDDGTVVRFDGATPFVNLQVSHDPGQLWVLVFAMTMMGGLVVSLVVRRRRVWARIGPGSSGQERSDWGIGSSGQERSDWGIGSSGQERSDRGVSPSGTVDVELGGLARTDNSGWGEELDRLARRLSEAEGSGS